MKKRVPFLAVLLGSLMSSSGALGQDSATSPSKVGVINIQEAIGSTGEGKKAMADLQKKFQPKQQELQRLQQDIQAITDQLQKQSATLSDDEQRRLNRELEDKQKLLKRSTEDLNADAGADRDEAIRRIGQKMVRLISEYAQQNGYTLVVDAAQIPVYYASKNIDLTEEMVKRYDAANPVAEAAGATQTAPAARPAASAAKPASASPKPADKPKP
jgi:outer membrane protein